METSKLKCIGGIIGDMVGSPYELNRSFKTKEMGIVEMFNERIA